MAHLRLLTVALLTVSLPAVGQVGRIRMSPAVVDHFSWEREHRMPADLGFSMFNADAGFEQARASVAPPLTAGDPAARRPGDSKARLANGGSVGEPQSAPETAPRYFYHFRTTVENRGKVTIRSVAWDYVFRDPVTNEVARVVHFRSDTKIKPGKTKVLEGYTAKSPVNITSVAALKGGEQSNPGESVEIVRILFADGSVWNRSR